MTEQPTVSQHNVGTIDAKTLRELSGTDHAAKSPVDTEEPATPETVPPVKPEPDVKEQVVKPPIPVGAPGSVVKHVIHHPEELVAVVQEAQKYKGRTIVVLRDESDVDALQRINPGQSYRVNPRQECRAIWRTM